ncbi:choline/ethanolamine kinase-like protein 3 [Sarcoptes scabiei]|uniref:Choline/ethanolamine kinase-like protein 3 n=1 Tax=Sarcoptes scabiei TaxID=52283 RepID=A0A132AB53_SARSC|nr:choline/ethanolamine kinase-like protein 3 [Sarcoptes scabiei]
MIDFLSYTNFSEPKNANSSQMRDQAYEICRKYLSGEWNQISSDDMIFKTVSGGLSNLLFYCSLPSTHTPVSGEPSQVLLRMYGQLLEKNDTKITDSVITMLLSERNLGPKVYGIFPSGRLEEYIPARAMMCKELKDPNLSMIIARKLAIVHNLNVPIKKEATWLNDWANVWITNIRKINITNEMNPLMKELIRFDYENEFEILKTILSQCASPIVFCHNDLQEGNILLTSNQEQLPRLLSEMPSENDDHFNDQIVFIDFEFCAYNNRGFDIGNHFCERMFDYSNPEWPHFYSDLNEYPNEQAQRDFVREYLKQWKELKQCDDEFDNENHLIKEAEFYILASHLLWTLWSLNSAATSKITFGYLEYGNTRLQAYFKHKKYVLEKYSVKME